MSVAAPARATALPWWGAVWIANLLCLVITALAIAVSPRSELLRAFHLGIETNAATWWEATQILFFGLFMGSTAIALRDRDRAGARACTILALIALALYADELGSLHERLGMLVQHMGLALPASGLKQGYREAPFALLLMAGLAYSLLVLDRRQALVGNAARLVAAAFGLFALAGVQEMVEAKLVATRWTDALRTAVEEGTELVGTFLLLLAGVRARRMANREPLGSSADWRSLGFVVMLALLLTIPALLVRAGWTFEELRLPKLGDFGVVIPVAVFTCAAAAAALQALSGRAPTAAWWRLAAVLIGLSLAAEMHLHRYALGYVSWRYDLDLIAGYPILAWALLGIPALRRRSVYLGLLVLAVTVPLSVFALESPALSLLNLYIAALGSAVVVLQARPMAATQFTTVSRRTVVVPEATTRSR
jgi:hypothetical protein